MQIVSDELLRILSQRLKTGNYAKPVCRVEVDRLVYIPGRTEEVKFLVGVSDPQSAQSFQLTQLANNGVSLTNAISMSFPVQGYSTADITQGFKPGVHKGVDIGCPIGTPIVAAWAGKVITVDMGHEHDNYGHHVDIQHADGVWTRYAHMSDISVNVGDIVQSGQVIGHSGNTGDSEGPHLHFEVHIGDYSPDGKETAVDPLPYLKGEKSMYTVTTDTNSNVIGVIQGSKGAKDSRSLDFKDTAVFDIPSVYAWENWDTSNVTVVPGLSSGDTNGYLLWDINLSPDYLYRNQPPKLSFTSGFDIILNNSPKPFLVDIAYCSDFEDGEGELRVYVNGTLTKRITSFSGMTKTEVIPNIVVPSGDSKVRIEVYFTGTSGERKLALDYVNIYELDGRPNNGNIGLIDPTKGSSTKTAKLSDQLFNNIEAMYETTTIQVGSFVYMDTLTLDNIIRIETDSQYDMESATATITISNPKGYYSPDLNPYYFPEMWQGSPWSYFISGMQIGVLSENTPIRIFLGYGLNLIRVFTGLIDKVDMLADSSQMVIACRDMYKKILNKVIIEQLEYPRSTTKLIVGDTTTNPPMNRHDEIVAKAKYYAYKANPAIDYKWLLAICQHETLFGTAGWGRESQGSYILGYGAYSETNADKRYAGIDNQLYFGAKRVLDAMKSRGYKFRSHDDAYYFWNGGDLGPSYRWSPSPSWADSVWSIYQSYVNSTQFDSIPMWKPDSSSTSKSSQQPQSGTLWLKSAIVADLISYAGMYGWRGNYQDLAYPDAVIEETYLIEANQKTGKVIKAVPGKEGQFIEEEFTSVLTPQGWMNPFVQTSIVFEPFHYTVADAIRAVMQDTNYRYYCDRYGTFRLEQIDYNKPIVAQYTDRSNLITLQKTIDFSRGRSHVVVTDDMNQHAQFIDTDILMELKGEVRTTQVNVPWARTYEQKRQVAEKLFFDMKRLCRTLQVSVIGNPALDLLDRVYISNQQTTTRSVYTIKGIKNVFSVDEGYIQILDLMWSNNKGAIV